MSFKFDLSDYDDVKAFADDILDRVTQDKDDPQRMPKAPRDPWTRDDPVVSRLDRSRISTLRDGEEAAGASRRRR